MKKTCFLLLIAIFTETLFGQSLFDVASNGTPEEIQSALRAGAEINDRNEDGMSPLMFAAGTNQNPEVISALLYAEADAILQNDSSKTVFDYAKENEDIMGTAAYWELDNKRF